MPLSRFRPEAEIGTQLLKPSVVGDPTVLLMEPVSALDQDIWLVRLVEETVDTIASPSSSSLAYSLSRLSVALLAYLIHVSKFRITRTSLHAVPS